MGAASREGTLLVVLCFSRRVMSAMSDSQVRLIDPVRVPACAVPSKAPEQGGKWTVPSRTSRG
jgi:hypothetical protein